MTPPVMVKLYACKDAHSINRGTPAALNGFIERPYKLIPTSKMPGATLGLSCANREKSKRLDTARNKLSGWTAATEAFGATMATYFVIKTS